MGLHERVVVPILLHPRVWGENPDDAAAAKSGGAAAGPAVAVATGDQLLPPLLHGGPCFHPPPWLCSNKKIKLSTPKIRRKKIHFYRLSTSKTPTCGYCEGEYWLTVGRIVWFRANCPLKLPFSGSWVEEEKSSIFSNGKKELERGWSCFGLTFPLEVLIPALQSASSWVVEPSAVSKLLLLDPEIPKLKSKLCSDPPAEKKSKISEILTERKSWSCTILRFWPVVFSSFS